MSPTVERWPVTAAFVLAPLVATASLAGILVPSLWAHETPSYAAQGLGQDWADLLLLVPTLIVSGACARSGARTARLVLAGALLYCSYTFAIYGFAVHFNALFFIYCADLGLSVYALAGLARGFTHEDFAQGFGDRAPVKPLGWVQVVCGVLFAALWLSEDVPALLDGSLPSSVQSGGLFTNPVHVLDLAIVIPATLLGGIALLRRRPLGYVLAPVLAVFGVLMTLTIALLVVVLHLRGVESNLPLAVGMLALALIWGAALLFFLVPVSGRRAARRAPAGRFGSSG